MNEFERRMLDIGQRQVNLNTILASMGRSVLSEHFGYTVEFDALVAGALVTKFIAMQSDAWFVVHSVSSCVVSSANDYWATDGGSLDIQITNTGNGTVLYSNPSSAGVLTSVTNRANSGIPFLLPTPVLIPPNTNVKIDLTQFGDTANTYNQAFVSLMGTRVAMI